MKVNICRQKKKRFSWNDGFVLFFTTWHAFWWITQIFRCIRKVNIYFFYLLCFGLCTNIQQRYCYVRKRQYVCMFFWQSINACDDIFSARRKIFIADIERRWRTFSRRLSPKDLAIRRSKTNDKTKGPKVWLPTYFEKKSCWKFDLSWGFCIKWLIDSQGVDISIRLDACISS